MLKTLEISPSRAMTGQVDVLKSVWIDNKSKDKNIRFTIVKNRRKYSNFRG